MKDTGGPAPDVAKRLAQELVTRDKVQFLGGFVLTPNALAVAPVATQAKVPTIIMNAATSIITTKSPYIARVSFTLSQVAAPLAEWAAKNKIKHVYTLVSDYGPGNDAEATFKKVFTAHGGEIVGSVKVPLKNPDFSPFIQRIKDAKPEAVFVFVPAGEASVGFMKAFAERGLDKAGIKLIGTGDLTDDDVLDRDGRPGAGRDQHAPLLGGARIAREHRVQESLRRRRGRRCAPQLHGGRRLGRHAPDLRRR